MLTVVTILSVLGALGFTFWFLVEQRRCNSVATVVNSMQPAGVSAQQPVDRSRSRVAPAIWAVGRGLVMYPLAVILGLVAAGLFVNMSVGDNSFQPFHDREFKAKQLVNDWLEAQRMGRDGNEFWSRESWVTPTKLFAVRDWEIVDASYGTVMVRIESSNGLRQPIVALWRIRITDAEDGTARLAIYSVEDADKN